MGVARPGSASAALGNAVVLRMNNMGYLPAAGQTEIRMALIYVFTSAAKAPLHWQPLGQSYWVSLIASVPRIPDQRLARPEYHHHHNTHHAQHSENQPVHDNPDT